MLGSYYDTINLDGLFDLILIKDKNKDTLYKPVTVRYKSNNTSVTYCILIVCLGLLILKREIVKKKESGIENYGQKVQDKEKKKGKKYRKNIVITQLKDYQAKNSIGRLFNATFQIHHSHTLHFEISNFYRLLKT